MRIRTLTSAVLALLAALALATPARATEIGVNEVLHQTVPTAQTATELGAGWVRLWASWEYAQPAPNTWESHIVAEMNQRVAAAKAQGLQVLMVVQRSPAWASGGKGGIHPPTDPGTFGAAMRGFAEKVPGVDAWELWNEEDESMFWAGGADPARYTAMVKAAYPAIKAVQPNDIVVTGATVGNNFDFIEQLYAHGIKGSFDAIGVHTDTACLVDGPDFHYRDEQGKIGRYVFTGYREVHEVMARHGDAAKQIWMTELGWSTETSAPGSCNVGMWAGQKPLGVTEAQQAEFLTRAYRCLASDPFVGPAFWFGLQDIPGDQDGGGHGLFRLDGSPKPAVAAFKALRGGVAPLACGGVIDTSGPQIQVAEPLDGLKFVDMFDVDVQAVDSSGGAGIRRLEFYADGKFVRSFGDGVAEISPWWDSRYWRRGKHTLTFKAEDEAGNKASKTIAVYKVRKLPRVKTAAALALERLGPSTVKVSGRVTASAANASTKLRGKAFVVFQKQARKRWRTVRRIRTRAGKAVAVTQTLEAGSYRVFLRYPGVKGFKQSRSKPVRFRVA